MTPSDHINFEICSQTTVVFTFITNNNLMTEINDYVS